MKLKILYIVISFVLLFGIQSSSAFALDACYLEQEEEVIQGEMIEAEIELKECSSNYRKDIDAATATIKAFWSAKKNHLSYFSDRYRKVMEQNNLTFKDRHNDLFFWARDWYKQKYTTTTYYQNKKFIQIIVLSTWFQEGDKGTTTFTFGLVYEKGKWTINSMIY